MEISRNYFTKQEVLELIKRLGKDDCKRPTFDNYRTRHKCFQPVRTGQQGSWFHMDQVLEMMPILFEDWSIQNVIYLLKEIINNNKYKKGLDKVIK